MSEERIDRRSGERRNMEPCAHERDWIRLEQVVERHDRELRELQTYGAETKVYMKQVLDSQEEIKESIRGIQDELRARPSPGLHSAPAEAPLKGEGAWSDTMRKLAPDVVKLLIILVIIIAVLVGADNIVTKAIAGGAQ